MTSPKTILSTLLIIIVAFVAYLYTSFDPKYEIEEALQAFLNNNYNDAYKIIAKVEKKVPRALYHLLGAYVSRAEGNREMSDLELEAATQTFEPQKSSLDLQLEISLNRGLNAYLDGNYSQLKQILNPIKENFSHNKWVTFFESLEQFYANQNYGTALQLLEASEGREALSGWMEKSFSIVYNLSWEELFVARCLIETGNYLVARQMLEEGEIGSEKDAIQMNFLFGLSYLKEAQEKPLLSVTPLYKLAFTYFQLVPLEEKNYKAERELIIKQVATIALQMIEKQEYENLLFYAIALKNLKADANRDVLIANLFQRLDFHLIAEQWDEVQELATLLSRLINEDSDRVVLYEKFNVLTKKSLIDANGVQARYFWELSRLFSNDASKQSQQSPLLPYDWLDKVSFLDNDVKLGLALMAHQNKDLETAYCLYQQYFSEKQASNEKRGLYIDVLMQLHHYAAACEQIEIFNNGMQVPASFQLEYVEALIKTGKFDEAKLQAITLFKQDPPLPLLQQFKLAKLMLICKETTFAAELREKYIDTTCFSLEEKLAYIELLQEEAMFEGALAVAKTIETDLKNSSKALVTLIRLQDKLGHIDEAKELAEATLIIDSNDQEALAYLESHEQLPQAIIDRLNALKEPLTNNPSEQMNYSRHLTRLTSAAVQAKIPSLEPFQEKLLQAYYRLDKLILEQKNLPQLFSLLGKMGALLKQTDQAIAYLEKAIRLDPSDCDALRVLAVLYEQIGEENKALQSLEQAVKYAPSDASLWQALSLVELGQRNFQKAEEAAANALKYSPNDSENYFFLGQILLTLNRGEEAYVVLNQAAERSPNDLKALKLLLICLHEKSLLEKRDGTKEEITSLYRKIHQLEPNEAKALSIQYNESYE